MTIQITWSQFSKESVISHLITSAAPANRTLMLFLIPEDTKNLNTNPTVMILERYFSYCCKLKYAILWRIHKGEKKFSSTTWCSFVGHLCWVGLEHSLQWSKCWQISGITCRVQAKTSAALCKCGQCFSKWSSEKKRAVIISIVRTYWQLSLEFWTCWFFEPWTICQGRNHPQTNWQWSVWLVALQAVPSVLSTAERRLSLDGHCLEPVQPCLVGQARGSSQGFWKNLQQASQRCVRSSGMLQGESKRYKPLGIKCIRYKDVTYSTGNVVSVS